MENPPRPVAAVPPPSTEALKKAFDRYQELKHITESKLGMDANMVASAKANHDTAVTDLFIEAAAYYGRVTAEGAAAEKERSREADRRIKIQGWAMVILTGLILAATGVSAWGAYQQGKLADQMAAESAARQSR